MSDIIIVGGVVIGGALLASEMPRAPSAGQPKSNTPNAGSTIGDATQNGGSGGTPVAGNTKPKFRIGLATVTGGFAPASSPVSQGNSDSGVIDWIKNNASSIGNDVDSLTGGALSSAGDAIESGAKDVVSGIGDTLGSIF